MASPRNPAFFAARDAFAALFSRLMREGVGAKKKPWTDEAFARALGRAKTRSSNDKASLRKVGYWRQGTYLPKTIEPVFEVLYGRNFAESENAMALSKAFDAAFAEKRGDVMRDEINSHAPQWAPEGTRVALQRDVLPTDKRVAANPNHQQLQKAIRDFAETLRDRLEPHRQRYGNAPTWRELAPAATKMASIAALGPPELVKHLGEAYACMLQLGSLAETDTRVRGEREPSDPPLDADISRALTDLVRTAAPWMRGFPTVAKWDDDGGKLLARPADALRDARAFLRHALGQQAIDERDAEEIEDFGKAGEGKSFPAEKAAGRSIGAATNLIWTLAAIEAAARAGSIGAEEAERLRLAERAGLTFRVSQKEILALTQSASPDAKASLAALFAPPPTPPPPNPPDFDVEAKAHELVLQGIAPPQAWRPFIRNLAFEGTRLRDALPLAGLTELLSLDLWGTEIVDLRPLAGLTALRTLNLAATPIKDLSPLAGLISLELLNLRGTKIADARPLDLEHTQIADAAPLAGLTALQSLNLSDTQIADAAPLAGLTALQSLNLSDTQIADAAPLAGLTALHTLNLSDTQIADAAPLAGLTALQTLYLSDTQIADAAPLAGLTALHTLNLRNTKIADAAPLAGLTALQSLDLEHTQVADAAPLAGLTALQSLDLRNTQIADAAPLAGLTALQSLDLRNTKIADAAPLAGLTALQTLDLSDTQIADAAPLAGLTALQSLYLRNTQITDAAPLAGLTALQSLDLMNTKIADAAPLAGLTALQSLNLMNTKIADAAPLAGLTALQSLNLMNTKIADAAPLAGLTALQTLFLRNTKIADAAPLAGLTALQTLDLEGAPIADVTPLAALKSLRHLGLKRTRVVDLSPLSALAAGGLEIQAENGAIATLGSRSNRKTRAPRKPPPPR